MDKCGGGGQCDDSKCIHIKKNAHRATNTLLLPIVITDHILCRWICNYGVDCDFNNLPHVIRISHTHTHTQLSVWFYFHYLSVPRYTVTIPELLYLLFTNSRNSNLNCYCLPFHVNYDFWLIAQKRQQQPKRIEFSESFYWYNPRERKITFSESKAFQWMGTLLGLWR